MTEPAPGFDDYLAAARCPPTMPTGEFGLWKIERFDRDAILPGGKGEFVDKARARFGPFPDFTILTHRTEATLHQDRGETVMEDTAAELRRHMPIWLCAFGRVLVTGLGLGCVVRGLLANPAVEHITVIELDSQIIRAVWPEFAKNERLLLLQGDAFEYEFPPGTRYDFAWHDIWREGTHEAVLHAQLMVRYRDLCEKQGAWGMPRWWRRKMGGDFLTRRDA